MNEAETRAEHIDPALKAAGWGVVEGRRVRREYPITPGRIEGLGRRGKPLTADYVLEYRNRKLAVIEANTWDKELTEGVAQAKNYAGKLAVRCAYATNGQGIYGMDMETGTEGETPKYPPPDELWQMTFHQPDAWRDRSHIEALQILGDAYTKSGQWDKGLKVDQRLARLCPTSPLVFYNLACSYSLMNRLDAAFVALERAVKLGYKDAAWLVKDPDLSNLRQDARFIAVQQSLTG